MTTNAVHLQPGETILAYQQRRRLHAQACVAACEGYNPTQIQAKLAAYDALLDAAYSALNLEGLALRAEVPALEGLDVAYHFDKLRAAIALAVYDPVLEGKS